MRKLMIWIGLTTGGFVAADAAAFPCGTILTTSVVLTADVVCGPGQLNGLIVNGSNVEIDLNGFSVVTTWVTSNYLAVGIQAVGVDAVTVRGPGSIQGFAMPIEIEGGVAHTIQGVKMNFPIWSMVRLRNVSLSVLEDSVIDNLRVEADPGMSAAENRISRNLFTGGDGLLLDGCGVHDNLVQANRLMSAGRVTLHRANGNWVLGNRIGNGSISLAAAAGNTIASNWIRHLYPANFGIWIGGYYGIVCGGVVDSTDNRITGNRIENTDVGVELVQAARNVVSDNMLMNANIAAVRFSHLAADNDARYNNYVNVATIAIDYGTGNLWP